MAMNFLKWPHISKTYRLRKITLLKSSISHLNERLRMAILNLLRPIEGRVEVL